MNWINYVMYALGLTCLTGSVWSLIWCMACVFLKRNGNTRQIYKLIKFAMVGYIVPVLFLLLTVYNLLSDSMTGYLFITTPKIQAVLQLVFGIWLAGILVCCLVYFPRLAVFYNICGNCMPVLRTTRETVKELCREMNIHRNVEVCQGYSVVVPFIYGLRHPRIYLPVCRYSQTELEMILTHELVHLKQRDVFWKPVFVVVCCIYWFNPLVWFLAAQFQKWAEASCDLACCEKKYQAQAYFTAICSMADTASLQIGTFAPTWQEGEDELKWRIQMMKKNQWKNQKKWMTAVVTAAVILMSTTGIYAAEAGSQQVYNAVYERTSLATEEVPVSGEGSEQEEYIGDISDFEGMEIILDEETPQTRAATIIDWSVSNNGVRQSSAFNKNKGDEIYISVSIDPSDKEVEVGIITPGGNRRYVTGSGDITHSFAILTGGDYRVFISNKSGTKITAVGYYK